MLKTLPATTLLLFVVVTLLCECVRHTCQTEHHQTNTPQFHAAELHFHPSVVLPLLQLCYYLHWRIGAEPNCAPYSTAIVYTQ